MADEPKVIKFTLTSAVAGEPITIKNRTTGQEIHDVISVAAQYVFDCSNFTDFTLGDIIEVKIAGERLGFGTVTTSEDDLPQTSTISTSAITSGLSRGI